MDASQIHQDLVPAPAALVRDFVNTLDHELGTDALATTDGLVDFLVSRRLVESSASAAEADRTTAVRLRTALHAALELNHAGDGDLPPGLDAVVEELPVRLAWSDGGVVVLPAEDGVRGALAGVALAVHECVTARSWWRLKICAFDECEWAYFDQSKNRSARYCEYGCGNKVKTRAYRARVNEARRAR